MGGPRVAPEQLGKALEVLGRTNNLSEAAASIGVNESTLRSAVARLRIARNRELHTRACERGLHEARRQLNEIAALVAGILRPAPGSQVSSLGLEGGDIAKLVQAFNGTVSQRIAIGDREDRRRQAGLTRCKTKLEARLAATLVEKAEKASKPVTQTAVNAGSPRWKELQREYFGGERQGVRSGERPDGSDPPERSDGPERADGPERSE